MSRRGNRDMGRFDQDGDGDFDIYDVLLLVIGIGLAGGLWYASMTWSVDGFEIAASDRSWIGWMLGFTITYLQIIFNRGSQNETLWWFGLASYGYGFTTNIVGILASRSSGVVSSDWWDTAFNISVVVFLAAIVEWVPEHLVVRLLRANKGKESDFMSELRKGVGQFSKSAGRKRNTSNQGGTRGNQQSQQSNQQSQQNSHQGQNIPRPEFPDLRRR